MAKKPKTKEVVKKYGGPFLGAAFFCESLIEDTNKRMSAIGIVDGTLITIPHNAPADIPSKSNPFLVVQNFLLLFRSGDSPGRHILKIVVEQPDGKRKAVGQQDIFLSDVPYGGCHVKSQAAFKVFSGGVFWVDVFLDGKRFTRMPFNITFERATSPDEASELVKDAKK